MSSQSATYLQQQENLRHARRVNLERMSKGLAPLPLGNPAAPANAAGLPSSHGGHLDYPASGTQSMGLLNVTDSTRGNRTALHRAAETGDNELVESLLEGGAYIDGKDRAGLTALAVAVQKGNVNVARTLIEAGAQTDDEVATAARGDSAELLVLLLEAGAEIYPRSRSYGALLTAVYATKAEHVRILLDYGADANADQVLGIAINKWSYKPDDDLLLIIRQLVAAGADVNQKFHDEPVVQRAVDQRMEDVTRLLVETGANIDFPAHEQPTLFLYAVTRASASDSDMWSIVCYLARKGFRSNKENNMALFYAASRGRENEAGLLLSLGADIEIGAGEDSKTKGRTPIMAAAEKGHAEVVRLLAQAGANVDARAHSDYNYREQTTLMEAAKEGHTAVVRILAQAGAVLDLRDAEQNTALILAAEEGHADVVRCLADAGANLNLQGDDGRTALLSAILCGGSHDKVVLALLEAGADPLIKSFGGKDYNWYIEFAAEGHHSDSDDDVALRQRLENISRHLERYVPRGGTRDMPESSLDQYERSMAARMYDIPDRSMDSYMYVQSRSVQPSKSKLRRLFGR
ncbi:hypothetical protein PRZ48_009494 [Zasmidium cellare]|uniref:Ankyrin repeat protein n=1 Tax=Zasmidium cellare TaxID=395010 RepID=A0ABR0ED36_ZASCE|nr:hypothetical protein PRZ48_009494 [Zasmidium cellare]